MYTLGVSYQRFNFTYNNQHSLFLRISNSMSTLFSNFGNVNTFDHCLGIFVERGQRLRTPSILFICQLYYCCQPAMIKL